MLSLKFRKKFKFSFIKRSIKFKIYKRAILNKLKEPKKKFSEIYKELSSIYKFYPFIKRHIQLNTTFVIGDSHTNFFSGNENLSFKSISEDINSCSDINPFFTTFHLGPCLAYSINKKNSTHKLKEKIDFLLENSIIPKYSRVIFALGEIDIRVHLIKQSQKLNIPIEDLCNSLIDNYLNQIKLLSVKYKLKIYCWSPIATQNENLSFNKEFPAYGTEHERNKVTLIFSNILKEKCMNFDFVFLSITQELIDENNKTKLHFISCDYCHLSQKAWKDAETNTALAYNVLKDANLII